MSVNVKVEPFNSESISTAIVGEWFKEEGDYVEADELLVELETDKINIPVHSPVAGVLTSIKAAFDEEVSEGDLLAEIEEGAKAEGSSNDESSDDQSSNDSADEADKASSSESQHDALSPAVQRLVEENDLDPADIKATGPNGRLLKGDVLAYLESGGAKKADSSSKPASKPAQRTRRSDKQQDTGAREERERMSRLRQTVAKRLVSAQQDAAMLTTFNEVDMSAVIELRNQYKMAFKDKYGIKLGFMSFFIKAAIEALKAYPKVNAEIDGDTIVYKNYYNIGVAVGGGRGLVVPVIRDADQLSFAEVELTINELVDLAVNNRLTLDDLTGGTFTLSNGGIYGSMLSTPILNPPQSGILGMHNIVERPVAIDGQVEIRPIMYLALSYDHRIIDGREAVSFLVRLKECIEAPERILLEI